MFGDRLSMGTDLDGDRLSSGTNFLGPIVQGDRKWGDLLSIGTKCLGTGCGGPEVRGSNGFGTKCVAAQILPYVSEERKEILSLVPFDC